MVQRRRHRWEARPPSRGVSSALAARAIQEAIGIGPLFAIAILAGCAQVEAPRGGPEDREPPRVVGTWPDSGATRVPAADSIALRFSEPVDRRTIEDAFFLSPPVLVRQRAWKGQTWILHLAEPLREGVTYSGLLSTQARDRHGIALPRPWSFAFSTGDSLDSGRLAGQVVGQRFPGKGAFVFVWEWEAPWPDTTGEAPGPDPLRIGQADAQGAYELGFLPRGTALRVCALYDRNGNRRFDPGSDRWACTEAPVAVADTGAVTRGVDLFLADADEPGTVAGSIVDSACARSLALATLRRVRSDRESLRTWLEARPDSGALTADDSLRIGRRLLQLDSLQTAAAAESADCAAPLIARLIQGDSTLVREARGPSFQWTDVPAGLYRLLGFRDRNASRRPEPEEPAAWFPHALEVRPLRALRNLELLLPAAPGEAP